MEGWFGVKHIIGLSVMIAISIIFFVVMHFFVNKHEKGKLWALRGICLFLILLEFLKYIMLLRGDGIHGGGSIGHGNFPFQLCSMPLYLFPFVAFGKKDSKFVEFLKPAAFTIGLLAGIITLLYPSNVLFPDVSWLYNGGFNFSVISFFYHTTMIVFAIYMLISKNYKMKAVDALKSFAVIFALSLVAIVLNAIIPGADYFLLGVGNGNPLNFIIKSSGKFVYILTMMFIVVVIIALLYSFHIVKYFVDRKKQKKPPQLQN